MRLTVLNVAYPLAPVGPDAVGGAEQVLTRLDDGLVRGGHTSIVIACEGSRVKGTLLPVANWAGSQLDEPARQAAWQQCRGLIKQALTQWPIELVHLHGMDFLQYLPPPGVPTLATLHLPPNWYPPEVFHLERPRTFLNCVSATQQQDCPVCPYLLGEIDNGVPQEFFRSRHVKGGFALSLGRICPEKGFHLALEAARMADVPWLLAGQVYPYPAHQEYFDTELRPRLDRRRRFIGAVGGERKRRLLAGASCLLAPSQVAETSSLVAMEALACGTPVVANRAGALAEIVEHGRTGFLVRDVAEMAEAIRACAGLSAETCRRAVAARFSLERMLGKYFELYQTLTHSREQGVGRKECDGLWPGRADDFARRRIYFT